VLGEHRYRVRPDGRHLASYCSLGRGPFRTRNPRSPLRRRLRSALQLGWELALGRGPRVVWPCCIYACGTALLDGRRQVGWTCAQRGPAYFRYCPWRGAHGTCCAAVGRESADDVRRRSRTISPRRVWRCFGGGSRARRSRFEYSWSPFALLVQVIRIHIVSGMRML
jgi:hypothetical protein